MLRVVVAHPDALARQGWVALLEAEKDITARGVGDDAALVRRSAGASCVLIIVGADDQARTRELLRAVREASGPPVLLVLTGTGAPAPEEALAAGAAGVLVEGAAPTQVIDAVRAAASGRSMEGDTGLIPVTGPLVQTRKHSASPLTDREIEMLALADQGLSNPQIAQRTYLSLSAVKSHLSHVYGRLGVRHRAAAVAEARRRGLLP